ncbi:hypothetical protein F4776DRAFT_668904 [Hypoxylon sp. NC0597]|nr:hypothetical protein F4776DRAFT_668904 [Hypoxylon sp. NC0597]
MEECLGGLCAEICGRFVLNGLATAVLFIVEKQIVQRRELVIRRGRQAQRILHVPECLTVFTEEEPGMLDSDIRLAGTCLSISYFFASLAIFCVATLGASIWGPSFWIFGIANPLCVSTVIWLMLIESKRRRLRYTKVEADQEILIDRSFEEDVRSMWRNNKMKFGFAVIFASFTALAAAAPLNINLGAYSPALVVGDGAIGFNGGEGEAAAERAAALEGQGIASN